MGKSLNQDALSAAYAAAPVEKRDMNLIAKVIRAYVDAEDDISKIVRVISSNLNADMTVCGYCGTWRKSPCGEGCHWGIERAEDGGFRAMRELNV